jgi:hypothetical protein
VEEVMTKEFNALDVLRMPVSALVLDKGNARIHGPSNMNAIKLSLTRFGQQKPIVIGDNGVVYAGNGTLLAARELGWETVKVCVSSLPHDELRAYALADNRTAELAEWDEEQLALSLRHLADEGGGVDAAVELGWAPHEVDAILGTGLDDVDLSPDGEGYDDDDPVHQAIPEAMNAELEEEERRVREGATSITFTDEEISLIDDVALRLSPDEEMTRKDAIMSRIYSALPQGGSSIAEEG